MTAHRSRGRRWAVVGALAAAIPALVVLCGPFLMQPNPRLLPERTPAVVGLTFEPVEFSPGDLPLKLRGWWIPADQAKAAVVMVHGGGEDNRSLPYGGGLDLMRDLAAHGYAVLALDLRNYGESDASPEMRPSFGVRESNDVIGALDYLTTRDLAERFAALGFSMGGSTVIYAGARDARLEAVITDSAFAESRTIAAGFVHAAMGLPFWMIGPLLSSAEHVHGMELSAGLPISVVHAIAPRRLLVIHDAADPIVPVDQARRLAAACPGSELWITDTGVETKSPFGTHIQAYTRDPRTYVEHVTRFLDETFAAVPAPTREPRGAVVE
jgi:pimeloyl-ACP methyl ester carboxylesterase